MHLETDRWLARATTTYLGVVGVAIMNLTTRRVGELLVKAICMQRFTARDQFSPLREASVIFYVSCVRSPVRDF